MFYIIKGRTVPGNIAYKIYQVEVQENRKSVVILKSVAGTYFSMQKGMTKRLEEKLLFDNYKDAKDFVLRDAVTESLYGNSIDQPTLLFKRVIDQKSTLT